MYENENFRQKLSSYGGETFNYSILCVRFWIFTFFSCWWCVNRKVKNSNSKSCVVEWIVLIIKCEEKWCCHNIRIEQERNSLRIQEFTQKKSKIIKFLILWWKSPDTFLDKNDIRFYFELLYFYTFIQWIRLIEVKVCEESLLNL